MLDMKSLQFNKNSKLIGSTEKKMKYMNRCVILCGSISKELRNWQRMLTKISPYLLIIQSFDCSKISSEIKEHLDQIIFLENPSFDIHKIIRFELKEK